ncbi:MAG TPA: serpin family protein, partial [Longimicrobium sp.]|nr:serpin family protein [Longimicrobium sp.]
MTERGPDYVAFGLDLFQRLAGASPDENVVISPVSAGLALGMLANGATGQTLAQIERTLATGLGLDALNEGNAALSRALHTDDVELAIANSLWARGPFLPAFVERVERLYGAEAGPLVSAKPINDWVSRNTAGRIKEMVQDPISPLIILFLLNAVYFKGRWQDEFDPERTRPRTFHTPSGPMERPMMSRAGYYGWLAASGFRAVRLPYRGDRFAMYVLLPDEGEDLARLRERLTAEAWAGWMDGVRGKEVQVVMPRYRIEAMSPLNDPLQAMGMRDAFVSGRAALDGMLPADFVTRAAPYVAEVLQKVFVEVNEEGTEAAAATVVAAAVRSLMHRREMFVVDRPFLLAIRDDTTGALLFIGQVN